MERWSRSWVAFLIIAFLASGCYLNALGGSFVSDDHRDIVDNTLLWAPDRLPELFTTPLPHRGKRKDFIRPITTLTYLIDHRLYGPNPFGFHLENLLWHTAASLLVLVLLRRLWPNEPLMTFGAAALFAVHPVHTEAVAWVSGRSEILAAFWGLLAFWAHLRADRGKSKAYLWKIAAVAAWLVALGAKEMAATLPLLLLMTDALLGRPSGWWRPGRLATRYGPYIGGALAYVALRWSVFHTFGFPESYQVFVGAPLSVRGPTMLKVGAAYVGRLLFPVNLNASWDVPNARGLTDGALPLLALALIVGLLVLAWAVRRTAPPVAWGILWSGLALFPVSNIVPIGELGAERFLYFSSLGACVALAWVMTRGVKPLKEDSSRAPIPLAGALVLAVLVLFSANTIKRNQDWSNNFILWDKTVRQSPLSFRAHNNLGSLLARKGRYAEAESLIKRALAIKEKALGPDHPYLARRLNNLAELYRAQGQYAKAEPLYQRALANNETAWGPDHPSVATSLNNLAVLYNDQGQYAKAEPLYKRALAIKEKALEPDHPSLATSLNNLAVLYRAQGQYAKAEPLFKRALAVREKVLGPNHPRLATTLNSLALLYHVQGQYAKAEPLFKRALAIHEKALGPDHQKLAAILDNLAELYIKMGRDDEAKRLLERAEQIRAVQ
ncbi:MAG: tetratricopeptide repeat protein [Nitrospinae bacterium]|nr:tetratricopeptide repeat protein [Nitrospinota bacterium]